MMRVVEAVFAGIGIAAVAGGAALGIAKLIQKLKTAREFDQARLNDLHMKVYELQNSNVEHKDIFDRLQLLERDVKRFDELLDINLRDMDSYRLRHIETDIKRLYAEAEAADIMSIEDRVTTLENWRDSVVANEAHMVKHREITVEQKLKEADDA